MTQKKISDFKSEIEELKHQLSEANETIEMIRTGQIDALVLHEGEKLELYTLATADQAYRVFIENMTEGAVTLDMEGIIIYCNSSFALMLGLPLTNVIGSLFSQFVADKDVSAFKAFLNSSTENEVRKELDLKIFRSTGELTLPIQLSMRNLNQQGDSGLNILITDLSQHKYIQNMLKEKNQELLQINNYLESSNHDLQQFASVASHDLQEPMRKIQIFADLLQEKGKEKIPSNLLTYLNKIKTSADRMRALITDVLHYSKLSAENNQDELIDVEKIVQEIVEDMELMIKDKNAEISIGKLPSLYANSGQIRQVFQNVIGNALKFSKSGQPPVVQITGYRIEEKSFDSPQSSDGSFCLYSIKDNGIGFSEIFHVKIFEMFQRLHAREEYDGSGIGLAITKKIIEKHNGLVKAKSTPGKGTEFLLLFPYRIQR